MERVGYRVLMLVRRRRGKRNALGKRGVETGGEGYAFEEMEYKTGESRVHKGADVANG